MKRMVTLIIPLLILIAAASAQTKVTRSAIKFQIKNLGITIDGTIGGLQTNIQFNPAQLNAAAMEASVDVSTVNTDNDSRDVSLKSDEFFDMPHYPRITIKSVSFKHKSGDKYT